MSRYIDADKLKKFIDEKWKELADKNVAERGKELLYVSEKSYNLGLRDGKMEQKPVEWSKTDSNVIETLIKKLRTSAQFEWAVKKTGLDYVQTLTTLDKCLRFKQEWSEEDEIRLKEAIEVLDESIKYLPVGHGFLIDVRFVKDWLKSLRPKPHKWYIKKGHWYMCIVNKPEYGWTKGKVYQSPEDNRIETDYKGDLTNWPDSEPWFRPATRDEIPDSQPHWKPSKKQMEILGRACIGDTLITEWDVLNSLYNDLKKL